ncbi:hydroxyacylglutathione hydrolase [Orbus sturtevantii]|uniref:hydroxyacylglutathione hydrolase n=1 Tax=Orbus sturtevantii TaxID=3074109 RepID=UPI00370DAD62
MTSNKRLHIIPALKDNYIWLLGNTQKQVVIIDPGESTPVINYMTTHQLSPIAILLTHHHNDHIDGVIDLQKNYDNLPVFGPDEINLPITKISQQKTLTIGDFTFDIIAVPGHTLGHLAYYINPYLFCGDTLFSAGCGRVFEGTYTQMLNSLNKLKSLPDNTIVCPAHEYTLSNLKFATHLVPNDIDINAYYQKIAHDAITLPTTIEIEKKVNLFFRCDDLKLQTEFKINNELKLFEFFRTQKNNF